MFGKPKGVKVVGTVAVKYRDTNGNVWSGRGRQPFWLVKALAGGRSARTF
ncbi:H-NS histone family protein [Ralstonia sp. GP101]